MARETNNYAHTKETANRVYNDVKQKSKEAASEGYEDLKDKAGETYQQVRNSANDLYKEGKKKVHKAQNYLEEQSDEVIKAVKEKPLTSLLVASGVGFLLAKLLSK